MINKIWTNKSKSLYRKVYDTFDFYYNKLSIYKSFHKRHNNIYSNGQYKEISLTAAEKKEYLNYWKDIGVKINLETVIISKSLSGIFDIRIVPEEVFSLIIEPQLNQYTKIAFLENKNMYNKWFGENVFPKDYLHKINGKYYNGILEPIDDVSDYINSIDFKFPVVLKPSVDTYGGANVFFLSTKEQILDKIENFLNVVVQEKIQQHTAIDHIYKESINTVRVCLYRSIFDNSLNILNCSIRMGKDGSLDNETAGGIVCNIKQNGILNDYAIDKFGRKYLQHPNGGFVFKNSIFPYYEQLLTDSIDVANKIFNARIISLDMCLDADNKWRCIEVNLNGQTIRFAQYAGNPFFNKFSNEVIQFIKK